MSRKMITVSAILLLLLLSLGLGWIWQSAVQATASSDLTPTVKSANHITPTNQPSQPDDVEASSLSDLTPMVVTTTVESVESSTVEDEATLPSAFQLPQETDDLQLILDSLEQLAGQEQEDMVNKMLAQEGGWYHYESTLVMRNLSTLATDNTDTEQLYRSENPEAQIPHSQLIPDKALSRTFLRYNADLEVVEGISLRGEYSTGANNQISILQDDMWINVTLKEAGFTPREYQYPLSASPFYFPTQNYWQTVTERLAQFPDDKGTSWLAYQEGEQFIVQQMYKYEEPLSIGDTASGMTVTEGEVVYMFNAESGQLIQQEAYAILADGSREQTIEYQVLTLDVIDELPVDVKRLYEQVVQGGE